MHDVALDQIRDVIDCGGCGACCRHIMHVPFDDESQMEATIADMRPNEKARVRRDWFWGSAGMSGQRPVHCTWYLPDAVSDGKAGQCAQYDRRPPTCSERMQVGSPWCIEVRASDPSFVQVNVRNLRTSVTHVGVPGPS